MLEVPPPYICSKEKWNGVQKMERLSGLVQQYYATKLERDRLQEELDNLRQRILALVPGPAKMHVGDRVLEVQRQKRRIYAAEALRQAVSDQDLWHRLTEISPGKVAACLKTGLLTEEQLVGTYEVQTVVNLAIR